MADWYTPGYIENGRWDAVARMRHDGLVEGGIGRVISCQSCVALKYRRFGSCDREHQQQTPPLLATVQEVARNARRIR